MALHLPEGSQLTASLPVKPRVLAEDGRLHEYTLLLAMRLERLPTSGAPVLSSASPQTEESEVVEKESVQIYKNGGVGALGNMGAQEAALRPERWAWVAITREKDKSAKEGGKLTTYVNGQTCAAVTLKPAKKKKADDAADGDAAKPSDFGAQATEARETLQLERFCLTPEEISLFSSRTDADEGEPERGLSIKYLRVTTEVWNQETLRKELHALRTADEEADLLEEAEVQRAKQLCLQPLYARPPPIWFHPAFAAEFGDAFIGGTAFEAGAIHISLEVVCLALGEMLRNAGAAASLPHASRAALNSARVLLLDAKKLAHTFVKAMEAGQDRLFVAAVQRDLRGLEPGATMLLPCDVGVPLIFVVRRGLDDERERCTLTVVSCKADKMAHHRAAAEPPKIKFETCLELRRVKHSRLLDGAFWMVLWYAARAAMSGSNDLRIAPQAIVYQVLLSFLAEESLETAMAQARQIAWAVGAALRSFVPRPTSTCACSTHRVPPVRVLRSVPAHAVRLTLYRLDCAGR